MTATMSPLILTLYDHIHPRQQKWIMYHLPLSLRLVPMQFHGQVVLVFPSGQRRPTEGHPTADRTAQQHLSTLVNNLHHH
mmetsp:Transcript_4876/g.15742  ORF Transcript_4876/g.15742 Transcript_4876/m.15742 type:complete len:80 (-) Transcript_4876:10-249(-)